MSDIDSDTDNMLYKCDNRPKCKREVILYDRFDCYYCYSNKRPFHEGQGPNSSLTPAP